MSAMEKVKLTRATAADAVAEEVAVPRELGPVRLVRELGRGAMGVVWLGRHELLGREVAVKFLLNAVADVHDREFVRFIEGARAAAAVRHPGLNAILHADVVEGVPYLVMEYVDGPTLDDVIRRAGRLSVGAALATLETVCGAVGELHERDLVHRDIKPGNVLLDADGRAFVSDFGLACERSGPGAARLAGTPAYMAPEVFGGQVSPRSDVYALGVMTYELLTGDVPFAGSLDELQEKHCREPLPIDVLQRQRVDSALIDVLERATHKDAPFRYKTARHFLRALKEACPDEAVWSGGPRELARLVTLWREPTLPTRTPASDTEDSPYAEQLAERATERRRQRSSAPEVRTDVAAGLERAAPLYERVIAVDLACLSCGYNLRGIGPETRCPECGAPVADAVRPNRLLFADRQWLSKVYRGVRFTQYGLPAALIASLMLGSLKLLLLRLSEGERWAAAVEAATAEGRILVELLCYGLLGLGAFWATARERGVALAEGALCFRRLARAALISGTCGLAIFAVARRVAAGTTAAGWITGLWEFWWWLAVWGAVALLLYWSDLAARIPDKKLRRQLRHTAVVLLVVLVAVEIVAGLSALYGTSWETTAQVVRGLAAVLIPLDFWIRVSSYRRALRRLLPTCVSRDELFSRS